MSEIIVGTDGKEGWWLTGIEIVRCRDCKHGIEVVWPACYDIPHDWLNCHGYLAPSWDYYNDCPSETPVPPEGFCFWAERKEQ